MSSTVTTTSSSDYAALAKRVEANARTEAAVGSDSDDECIDLDWNDVEHSDDELESIGSDSESTILTSPGAAAATQCSHANTTKTNGSLICSDCGLQLKESLVENEQRCYDYSTPTRHHSRKIEGRSLYSDLEKHHLPAPVIEMANGFYTQMINGQIFRAKTRMSIVFACVFNAFKVSNESRNPEDLARMFGLDKKGISNGLKKFSTFFKSTVPQKHITALDLVPKLLADLGVDDPVVLDDISKIYRFAEQSSQLYKSSNPQSVAAGLIKYYLDLTGRQINKQFFAQVVGLTDITYTKLAEETARILNGDPSLERVPTAGKAVAVR